MAERRLVYYLVSESQYVFNILTIELLGLISEADGRVKTTTSTGSNVRHVYYFLSQRVSICLQHLKGAMSPIARLLSYHSFGAKNSL